MKSFLIVVSFFLLCIGLVFLYNSQTKQNIQFANGAVEGISLVSQKHGHECAISTELAGGVTIKKKCGTCKGTGKVTVTIKKRHNACLGKGCKDCNYNGYTSTSPKEVTCDKCKGEGWIVTKR